ncbi:hypothetical protein FRB97_008235 [Tulasnella sp. 331]|nr:hypothetical protein FRB97_008235 [Tulasnella sp. 331]
MPIRIPLQRRVINEASLEDGDPSKLDASEAKPRTNDRTLSRLRCFIPYGITPGANVGLGHALSQKFPDQIRPAAPAPVVRMSCPCCEEPEDVNNMLFCPKDHALCKECVRVLGDLKLSKGATQLLCEESRCKTAFPDKLLFRLLNNSQLKLLNKNRALKEIKESGIKGQSVHTILLGIGSLPQESLTVPYSHPEGVSRVRNSLLAGQGR